MPRSKWANGVMRQSDRADDRWMYGPNRLIQIVTSIPKLEMKADFCGWKFLHKYPLQRYSCLLQLN